MILEHADYSGTMRSAFPFLTRPALGLSLLVGLTACSDEPQVIMGVLPVHGVAIDGSEDVEELPEEPAEAPAATTEEVTESAAETEATEADPTTDDVPIESTQPNSAELPIVADLDEELTGDALEEAKAEVLAQMKPLPESEPDPEKKIAGEGDEDSPYLVAYRDLTLIDYDVDAMLDYMLFPEEYEGEETQDLQFPAEIKKLDGKVISIVGYMIPGEMDQGNVRDFMLVRDLLGCCFGGTPMPDEWVDVIMEEDAEAVYRPYMPTRVTGLLTLGGDQDEAGFALGVYKLKGTKVTVED